MTIVEAALRSLALALPVWLALLMLRVRNPHIEKTIWTVVLVCALAMPVLMRWPLPQALPMASAVLREVSIGGTSIGPPASWSGMLTIVYGAVCGLLSLRLAVAFVRMWRIRRDSVRLHDEWTHGEDIRASARLSSPVTFGATILLPAHFVEWSEPRRAAILAHEREHVRRRDCQVQWLAAAHLCIFWFSPLSWWLRSRLGKLAERSSDDAALRGTLDRADYAAVLLEAARSRSGAQVVVAMARGDVTQRIDRILSGKKPHEVPAAWRRVVAAALVLPAVAFAAGLKTPAAAAQGQSANAGAVEPDTGVPKARVVAFANLEQWYPEDAKQQGVNGMVQLAVTLDTAGLLTDTAIVSESPAGLGFGGAAEQAARTFTYENPTGHPTTVIFNVKFELAHPQARSGKHARSNLAGG